MLQVALPTKKSAGRSNKKDRQEDLIEVLADSVDNAGSKPGVLEASGRSNESAGDNPKKDSSKKVGKSSSGDHQKKQKHRRDDPMENDEENYVPWLDRLSDEVSFATLLCVWVRKFYGWLTLGVLCLICGILLYVIHPVLKQFSHRERLVTATVFVVSAVAFLATPFVRLRELFRARRPRFNLQALKNFINLA